MLQSEKIAIAAHLHVLLRRKTGRVTDTEWMASNAEYAAEIVGFARARAKEDGHADLADWADKLEVAMAAPNAKRAGLARYLNPESAPRPVMVTPTVTVGLNAGKASEHRYISGIR